VAERTLQELRSLSAGYPERFGDAFSGERIPTLAETLAFLKGRARGLVEIKRESVSDDAAGGVEALTVEAVRHAGMADEAVLISFERRALLRCRELAPEILRGHLFYEASADEIVEGARAIGSDLVLPHKKLLSDALVARCREAGLRVASWVVDDPDELRELSRLGLFAVGSNRPGELIDASYEGE
jgi:glycerophosphoryl diester phosphodiesterase